MRLEKLPGKRSLTNLNNASVLLEELRATAKAEPDTKRGAVLRALVILMESVYSHGWVRGQLSVLEVGRALMDGWEQIYTGGIDWNKVESEVEEIPVPVPDEMFEAIQRNMSMEEVAEAVVKDLTRCR